MQIRNIFLKGWIQSDGLENMNITTGKLRGKKDITMGKKKHTVLTVMLQLTQSGIF